MKKNNNLIKLIKDSTVEILDHGVNLASDEEIIKEIPIIKHIVSVNRIYDIYKARRLQKNVMNFLECIKDTDEEIVVPDEDYEEFVDTLTLVLIESEKPLKAKIVGNLTKAYAQRLFNFTTFNHLCLLVYSSSVPAINNLALCANSEMMESINNIDETHTSGKTHGIAPNVSIRIVGAGTVTPLLSAMGVIDSKGYLNGYGMALIKYGKMDQLEKKRWISLGGEKFQLYQKSYNKSIKQSANRPPIGLRFVILASTSLIQIPCSACLYKR